MDISFHANGKMLSRILPQAGAVVISREDVSGDEELIEAMAHQTRNIGSHRSRGRGRALLER